MPIPHMPLISLRAFEAAARLGSMSAAASELSVTHSAISHHVKLLEERFGMPLLERLPRAVTPTREGAQLALEVAYAFERLQIAVSRLQPGPIIISCSSTMMARWLIPRLKKFKETYPTIEISLNISFGDANFIRDEISIAIRTSMFRAPPTAIAETIIKEEIGPVCHPEYAENFDLRDPEDLQRARILASETRLNAWSEWISAIDKPGLQLKHHETYEHFYLAIQAATCKLGVALAPLFLVEDAIRTGHLVAPFGFISGPHHLQLWIAEHQRLRQEIKTTASWIKEEMRRTSAS